MLTARKQVRKLSKLKVMFATYEWPIGSSMGVYAKQILAELRKLPGLEICDLHLRTRDLFSIPIPNLKDLGLSVSEFLRSDIIHIPLEGSMLNLFPMPFVDNPSVITVHDLVSFALGADQNYGIEYSKTNPLSRHPREFLGKTAVLAGISKAQSVICVSESTRLHLVRDFKISKKSVSVIPLGVNHHLFKPIDKAFARRRTGIPENKRVILHVGSEAVRKNLTTLFKVFSKISANEEDYLLVRVGSDAVANEKLASQIVPRERRNKILFYSKVEESLLPYLYSSADIFVFPSVYEGFGLPVLEAMACACPVIASNSSSLPEIVGDSGILVNPFDVEEIICAVQKVAQIKDFESELRTKSLARSMTYSWGKCARETAMVYSKTIHS